VDTLIRRKIHRVYRLDGESRVVRAAWARIAAIATWRRVESMAKGLQLNKKTGAAAM
jgi:hypothetical protein